VSRPLPGVSQVLRLETTDSTQNVARFLAEQGAPHGTLVWADRQTKGRGRLDRSWTSPPGNLYISLVLRPKVAPDDLAKLSLSAAGAASRAASKIAGIDAYVKPPNDVYTRTPKGPRKVCGILLEAAGGARGSVDWLVLGIGLNVNAAPKGVATATSLAKLAGRALPLEDAAAAVLEELDLALSKPQ
jgi:BirA family biotin operon repressor/biotin-[acetyl-CoA-carboxylase] ligase